MSHNHSHEINLHPINVRKSSGDEVPFDIQKLKHALLNSGARLDELDYIVEQVLEMAYDGMSTKRIYQVAYDILRKESKNAAGRFRLKKAINDLGPSGYPFERFIGRLYQHAGYQVKVGQIVQGRCVSHEVDVIAENEHEIVMVECKFHSEQGRKSDVKVALYIKARFDDIKARMEAEGLLNHKTFRGSVATNTRFTEDAIEFGTCAGMSLIAWDYPSKLNLRNWVESSNLHIVTALSSATKKIKQILLEHNIVLCKEIIEQEHRLKEIGIPVPMIDQIVNEAKEITKRG